MSLRRSFLVFFPVALALAAPAAKTVVRPPPAADAPAVAGPASAVNSGLASANAAQGWIDLLTDPKLADWQRVPLPGSATLTPTSPWKLDVRTGVLAGDGAATHEMFLHRVPRGDGVFRVEWRFVGESAKPSAGIVVRTKSDGSASFQARLSPAELGTFFGATPGPEGKPRRFTSGARRPNLLRKAEEWNVTEITCLGPRLTLRINGTAAADWNNCTVPVGQVGLEIEGAGIEFRAVRFKPLP